MVHSAVDTDADRDGGTGEQNAGQREATTGHGNAVGHDPSPLAYRHRLGADVTGLHRDELLGNALGTGCRYAASIGTRARGPSERQPAAALKTGR